MRDRRAGAWPSRPALRGAPPGTITLVVAAAALQLLAACSVSSGADARRTVHGDEDGSLSASIGTGGNSLDAPDTNRWEGTFGGFVLCVRDPGAMVKLQRVRWRTSGGPVKVVPHVRTVLPSKLRSLSAHQREAYLPTYAALGSPPEFAQPYAAARLPGDFSDKVTGLQLTQSCQATAAGETSLTRGRVPAVPLRELMFTLQVGRRGGLVNEVDIDYLAGKRPMTLRLHWQMVACGSAITDPRQCST